MLTEQLARSRADRLRRPLNANVRAQVIPIYRPENGVELALAQSVLEAHSIPYFVHNGGFGGLYPGMQIDLYNVRTIMVPEGAAETAREVLAHFLDGHNEPAAADPAVGSRLSTWDRVRLIAELLICGWCVPRARQRPFEQRNNEP